MKHISAFRLSCLFFLLFTSVHAVCQVPTVILNGNDIRDYIPYLTDEPVEAFLLPEADISNALLQDSIEGIYIPRFAVKIPVGLTKEDGATEEFDEVIVWKKAFNAEGAISLNFEFANLSLPSGSQLFIYNSSRMMLAGPIESKHVYQGNYSSDVIQGSESIVMAVIPKAAYALFEIEVPNVNFGFQSRAGVQGDAVQERIYNSSAPCEVDVNCPGGPDWSNQRDAVALTIVGGQRWCTGALINNQCQDFRSFFLTANHCISPPPDINGFLNWVFRFNYDSPNPTLANNCHGDEPERWLSISGATLRAQFAGSDFALIELTNQIFEPTISFAGWDRSDDVPTSSTMIHHPHGDVKKKTLDNEAAVIESTPPTSSLDPNASFRINFDASFVSDEFGTLEGGSSGCPHFNQDQRIVGTHWGGDDPSCTLAHDDWNGRFFTSWMGGGTNETRLSNWLGGANAPETVDDIQPPVIDEHGPVVPSIEHLRC